MDRFALENPMVCAELDIQYGDSATVLYTDGTGMFQGKRTDLEQIAKGARREHIKNQLHQGGYVRPNHAYSRSTARI